MGWYITFETSDSARRASMVLSSRTLAHRSVALSVHAPPPPKRSTGPAAEVKLDDDELVEQATKIIERELRVLLEKDVKERIVGADVRRLVTAERMKGSQEQVAEERKPVEKRSLKGLSFKKQKKKVVLEEAVKTIAVDVESDLSDPEPEEEQEEEAVVERPRKKRRTEAVKKVEAKKVMNEIDVESEDEEPSVDGAVVLRKRALSEEVDAHQEDDMPVKKKLKLDMSMPQKKAGKKGTKADEVDDIVLPDALDFDSPNVAQVRFESGFESSLSPSRSPSPVPDQKQKQKPRAKPKPKPKPKAVTPPPSPPPDPLSEDLCEDDEDLYFARLALSGGLPSTPPQSSTALPSSAPPDDSALPLTESPLPFRRHITGSARTEGYYKITHAEKAIYVAQYQDKARSTDARSAVEPDEPQPLQHVTSSRSNRANARRRAQGLEEINQVQRAVALSKGETANANELSFKFNQLQTRKKHMRFARSPIHDWGLYAMEKISRGEMVIEYVGEVIRAQVADKREKAYERQGIGSSYLFRIDEDLVVDATKKGNLGYVALSCLFDRANCVLKTTD